MAREDQWKALWKAEKTTCHEYTGLRAIMDWAGYTDGMTNRRKAAWHWLDDRIAAIKAGKHHDDDPGQDQDRIAYMQAVLDGYTKYWWSVPAYPREKATDAESAFIKERTYYCSFFNEGMKDGQPAPYDEQQARKKKNYDWLVKRRQWILDCVHGDVDGEPAGWDHKARRQRYDNLNIATHHGDQWDEFKAGKYEPQGDGGGGWRDKVAKWQEDHLGLTEDPANSNCDNRKDGIRHAQDTCANGTWLRYQPWCGVWAFMGLYAAGLVESGTHSWMASVESIEAKAKAGSKPFRGWTTDGSKAKKGDLVVLFGHGVHVGTVRETPSGDTCPTWEGNTSSGSSGSQSNGGGSYKRSRSRSSETYGYALVRDP